MTEPKFDLQQSYDYCKKIAVGHYENFPVGSLLIPAPVRPHFYALYAFMRTADDFADQPDRPASERLSRLGHYRDLVGSLGSSTEQTEPIFIALADTIRKFRLPITPFERLLDAFEYDAKGAVAFEGVEDLRWYTSCSADPVGELVLALFGYRDQERISRSNEICSALQILNFVQDVKEDLTNGRCYFPREDCRRVGVEPEELSANPNALNMLMLFETKRAQEMLSFGAPLAESVRGRLKYELRAMIADARMLIAKIIVTDGDTYNRRPALTKREHVSALLRSLILRAQ